MKLKDLGMTEAQAVEEILTMREFNNFVEDELGDGYFELANKFAREKAQAVFEYLEGADANDRRFGASQ